MVSNEIDKNVRHHREADMKTIAELAKEVKRLTSLIPRNRIDEVDDISMSQVLPQEAEENVQSPTTNDLLTINTDHNSTTTIVKSNPRKILTSTKSIVFAVFYYAMVTFLFVCLLFIIALFVMSSS